MNRPIRIVYMGTPLFAVPPLKALCEAEEVVLAVTEPDRPAGRGRRLKASPVKEEALRRNIPVFQPERIREPGVLSTLRDAACDVVVVAAYGQMLPKEVLELPPHGCMNIHASLLPKYRGASPIVQAIIGGEKETGVTTMRIDEGSDTGDILMQKRVPIGNEETAGMLAERLSRVGAELMVETLQLLREGRLQRIPQDESKAAYFPRITKDRGKIDWNRSPREIHDFVRGMDPWPGAYTLFQGKPLKIWRVTPCDESGGAGKILSAAGRLLVGTRGGSVKIDELQLSGRKRVSGPDFLRGHHEFREGMVLGT